MSAPPPTPNGSSPPRRPVWRRALRPLAGSLALLFLMADDGITQDELSCEVAVVHLTDCCPGLAVEGMSCVHGGCDSAILPDLDEGRSACIQSHTCDELRSLGACDVARWEILPSCLPMGSMPAKCQIKVPPCM